MSVLKHRGICPPVVHAISIKFEYLGLMLVIATACPPWTAVDILLYYVYFVVLVHEPTNPIM